MGCDQRNGKSLPLARIVYRVAEVLIWNDNFSTNSGRGAGTTLLGFKGCAVFYPMNRRRSMALRLS